MHYVPRPVHNEHDFERMRTLIRAAWHAYGPMVYYHPAYLCLRARDPSYANWITLWETPAGDLAAFSEIDAGMFEWQIHPQHYTADLMDAIVRWNEEPAHWRGWCGDTLDTMCAERDTLALARLIQHGFQRTHIFYQHHVAVLSGTIDIPALPAGYELRLGTEPHCIEQRVAAHNAGWGEARMTVASYQRLMQTVCYRPELDIMVLDAGGTIIACCNVWLDELIQVGVFEPLSTHPEHRGRRIAEVMVRTGMRQLQRLGAGEALVLSSGQAAHVARLYERCGLAIMRRDFLYQKQ